MRASSEVDAAYAQIDLGSDQADVWVTARIGFPRSALAYFNSHGGSPDFASLWTAAATFPALNFGAQFDGLLIFASASPKWQSYIAGSQTEGPLPAAFTWQTLEWHYENGVMDELYVDGALVMSESSFASNTVRHVMLGFSFSWTGDDPLSIVYVDDVKVGTTRGSSGLFSDDFESGTFAAWTSTFGDVAVVDAPVFPAPPTQVFGGSRFYEAPPWRFIVGDLEDNTLTFLDQLAMDRSVTVTRAASRVISGRVPSDNPEVNIPAPAPDSEPFVSEGTRIVSCFRREAPAGSAPWVCRARGLVLSLTDDADTDHATSTFVAYDPWKYLYSRPVINPDTDSPLDATSYPAGYRANNIITEQLLLAQVDGGTVFTDFDSTAFYTGTIENTDPLPDGGDGLAITFPTGTTLGEMLDILVATGTCDVVFDPIYDIRNRPGLLCQLSIYRSAGSFRPNAVMGWDRWPRSLVQLSRQVEGTERANITQMYAGLGGLSVPEESDAASIARFGQYWELAYLPGVPSLAGAHTIAQRQLALLKDGQYTYSISPASERAPLLFEEYREADTVPIYASDRFRDPISGLPVRVESIPIVIGDDELERVNQMLVSFAPESGS